MTSGVTVIGAEAPSDYEMVARTENPSQIAGSPAVDASPVSVGFTGTVGKKKRGRPRKYQPDGMASMTLSPMPISSSAPLSGNFSSGKRGRGRPVGSESKQKQKVGSENSGNGGLPNPFWDSRSCLFFVVITLIATMNWLSVMITVWLITYPKKKNDNCMIDCDGNCIVL